MIFKLWSKIGQRLKPFVGILIDEYVPTLAAGVFALRPNTAKSFGVLWAECAQHRKLLSTGWHSGRAALLAIGNFGVGDFSEWIGIAIRERRDLTSSKASSVCWVEVYLGWHFASYLRYCLWRCRIHRLNPGCAARCKVLLGIRSPGRIKVFESIHNDSFYNFGRHMVCRSAAIRACSPSIWPVWTA